MSRYQHFASLLPLRVPHWRLNRVTEMLRHRPQPLRPRWEDDHPIRAYRRLLLELLAAGDDAAKLNLVKEEFAAVYQAHRYHYSPDFGPRQEIEARLLTGDSFEVIAAKLGADPKAVEYFASLFFDVRDALDHRDWILLTIRSRVRYDEECGCSRQEAKSGYVKRLFGYWGGSLVLDTLLNPFDRVKPPASAAEVEEFCKDASTQLIHTTAAVTAATIEVTGKTAMPLIRLAQRLARVPKVESGANDEDLGKRIEATLAWLNRAERM